MLGSLFVTTYSLALGDPVPRRIEAALVGDPASDQPAAFFAAMLIASRVRRTSPGE